MRRLASLLVLTSFACSAPAADNEPETEATLVEEVRIGGLDGDIEYTFGRVGAVAPSPDGTVFIADVQGPIIRHYDAEGRHLGDVGRAGQGPGEYSSVVGMAVAPTGELVVYDVSNARISWFLPDRAFNDSQGVPGGVGSSSGLVLGEDGSAFVRLVPEAGFRESAEDGLAADWARIGRDGAIERLVADLPEGRVGPQYVVGGRGGVYRPFVVMTLTAIGGDGGFYSVRNDNYVITHRRASGVETSIVRDEEQIRVTADERAEWEAFSEQGAARPGADRSDYFPIPAVKPFIRYIVVDSDGRLWVSRHTEATYMEYSDFERDDRIEKGRPSYQWRDRPDWDVFDAMDEYLGTVTLPFKTSFAAAAGSHVWGIQAGDYNEDYVVRWRFGLGPGE